MKISFSIVFLVLTNELPFLLPFEICGTERFKRMPSSRIARIKEVDIKIRECNSSYFKWMYEITREKLGTTRRKNLNYGHFELYKLVRDFGGSPKGKGTVAFWRSVHREWGKRTTKNRFNHWKSVKITYDRLINKIQTDNTGSRKKFL